jgi:hypothetical protein
MRRARPMGRRAALQPNETNRIPMTRFLLARITRTRLASVVFAAGALGLGACSPDEILEVVDPDIVDPTTISNAAGANALRAGALARFNTATSGAESLFLYGGLLADEFRSSDTFSQRDETDQRRIQLSNANIQGALRNAHGARVSALQAAEALQEFAPERRSEIAEMFLVQGYMENLMGEMLCSGIPMSTPSALGEPLPTADVYARAIAHADSAIAFAGTDALGTRVKNAAAVVKGRALLNLNQYAQAATAVATVATDFAYIHEQSQSTRTNGVWSLNINQRRYTLVDREGGNGLDYISANDPRIPVAAVTRGGGFDGNTDLYRQQIYPADGTSHPIMTGIEARLIEAEALLASNPTGALAKLNELRAASLRIGALTISNLPALTLATGRDAQVNQLFRERAFWMFATGHRLGDMRRLIRQYSRGAETVFPTGAFFKSGTYGPDLNIPVTQAEENNVNFTGCLDRNA